MAKSKRPEQSGKTKAKSKRETPTPNLSKDLQELGEEITATTVSVEEILKDLDKTAGQRLKTKGDNNQ
jgi:hypothetical protein